MGSAEFEIKSIKISNSDLDSHWAKWQEHLKQSIINSMRIPTPMQTFWIKGHHAIRNQDLRPGDHLDFCDSRGIVATLEVVQVRHSQQSISPEIELLVPQSGQVHLPMGLLVRSADSAYCTWVMAETIDIDNTTPSSSFTETQQLPSSSLAFRTTLTNIDPNSLNRPSRQQFIEVIEASLRDWHRGGKQKALQAIAEKMISEADKFIGSRNNAQTAQEIHSSMFEIVNFAKNHMPNWAITDSESEIKKIIDGIVLSVGHTGNTDHFRREYLGQWPQDDPSMHIAAVDAMMKAAEEEEKARKARRIERPDAPWKIE